LKVIIDTTAWSVVLRRNATPTAATAEVGRLVRQGSVQMLGVIRQELLSGIRSRDRFVALREQLSQYPDLVVDSDDHERAAEAFNECRSHGVQGNVVDMLICALAIRYEMPVFTFDKDFTSYARFVPLKLLTL
jgi:predicted nucleic acid-binding protein